MNKCYKYVHMYIDVYNISGCRYSDLRWKYCIGPYVNHPVSSNKHYMNQEVA